MLMEAEQFRSIRRFAIALCIAAGATVPRSFAGNDEKGNPFAGDSRSAVAGRELYMSNCADCHGATGRGDGKMAHDLKKKPTDLTDADSLASTDAGLFRDISRGRRPMPGFEKMLSTEQRWHIVTFIRTLSKKK
jgi:mono/diheme cytochrome c family protein